MIETTRGTTAPSMLKMSEAASMALHAAALLGAAPDQALTTKKMAEELDVSESHLSKVMQRLTRAGLIISARGPGGGFVLAKDAKKLRLLDIYEAIDGPLANGTCLLRTPICSRTHCIMGGLLDKLNREVKKYLAGTRVSDVVGIARRKQQKRGKKNG